MINPKIKKLRTKGLSLREISEKVHISYSTIQRACKNVRMSKQGRKRYLGLNGLTKIIKIKKGLNKEKVRIISNLLFDGAVYKNDYQYSIMYVNSSKDMINEFKKDMKKVYSINPSSFENAKTYYRVKYLSKQIYADLMTYLKSFSTSSKRCSLPSVILNGNRSFKITILRAFWENEGSISKEGKLSADLKSFKVISQLSQLHDDFGLKHNISKYQKNGWAYKLFLYKTKENYEKFLNLSLFSKAIVTKGHFIGRRKADVFREYFNNKFIL